MTKIVFWVCVVSLSACSYQTKPFATSCLGDTDLPKVLAASFDAVTAPNLLKETLGKPEQGKLCQGKVYQSKADSSVTLYRAWNSTNPNSRFGKWWAFSKPQGKVAEYRRDYEICYQWSPLDMLAVCTLKPGTKIVVGNGQSDKCSQYLTYPVSAKQQVYLIDAQSQVMHCKLYADEFNWKE